MGDETIRMPSSFGDDISRELRGLDSRMMSVEDHMMSVEGRLTSVEGRLTSVEVRLGSLEDKVDQIDWDSFRRDFAQHNSDVKELLGDLDRKFDVINHDLLHMKSEQIRLEKRIDKIELDTRR